jgi:hypothetical protein
MLRMFGGAGIDLVDRVAELRTMDRKKALVSTLARKNQRLGLGDHAGRSGIGSDMLPPTASPARTALPAAHLDRNKIPRIFGDRTLEAADRNLFPAENLLR